MKRVFFFKLTLGSFKVRVMSVMALGLMTCETRGQSRHRASPQYFILLVFFFVQLITVNVVAAFFNNLKTLTKAGSGSKVKLSPRSSLGKLPPTRSLNSK